jgi:hypothetical protein
MHPLLRTKVAVYGFIVSLEQSLQLDLVKYVSRTRQNVGELINPLQQPIIVDHVLE